MSLMILSLQGGDPVNRCSDLTQQPSDATNTFGLTYGPVSRCVEHGGPWTRTLAGGASVTASSAEEHGCYQVRVKIIRAHS